MARTRKTSDNQTPRAPEDHDRKAIEDAVVVDETASNHDPSGDPVVEETAPEAAPEIAGPDEHVPDRNAPAEPPDLTSAPEPAATAPHDDPRREPPPARSGASIAVPLIFGGVIAALAGFAASRFVFPDGWPGRGDTDAVLAELRTATEAQTARIADIETALAALGEDVASASDPVAAVAALRDELSGQIAEAVSASSQATDRLGAVDEQLGALTARIEELAMRPVPEGLDPASLDAELSEFRRELSAAVDEAQGQIVAAQEEAAAIARQAAEDAAAREAAAAEEAEATRASAEEAARVAARQAATARVMAALESGEPFAEDLAALEGVEVPAPLAAPAAEGVPTLAELVDAFPEAARAALDASIRAQAGAGALDRFTAFLRVQTGARSLEPQAGDDPDAVLSRAEAALRAGDLPTALTELGSLPEAGQAEMDGWIRSASTRLEAMEAAQGLPQN